MKECHNVAVVGLGKMGISHLAIAKMVPNMKVVAICDSSAMLGQLLERYCQVPYFAKYEELIAMEGLDGVILATPTRFHEQMIRQALAAGLHIFCEKPMTLAADISADLARQAAARGLVCQVGYHNRFVGTFREAKRLLELGTIGTLRHVHGEAYGPVVLRPSSKTWRSKPSEGGGCLYDYAAHPINLMNWYAGRPTGCAGAQLTQQWSADVDDAVYANLSFADDVSGQISVNWADETTRKMSTVITLWGDGGKIIVDRQEIRVFVGAAGQPQPDYPAGWTIRYITDLTAHPAFYLRGEEYSGQMERFATAMARGETRGDNDFLSASDTDFTLHLIRSAALPVADRIEARIVVPPPSPRMRAGLLGRAFGR